MLLLRHARGGKANSWADGPNREPVKAAGVAPVVPVRIEVEAFGAAVRADPTRPVDAPAASIVELGAVTQAGGREEDGVAVRAFHFVAVLDILRGTRPGAAG